MRGRGSGRKSNAFIRLHKLGRSQPNAALLLRETLLTRQK